MTQQAMGGAPREGGPEEASKVLEPTEITRRGRDPQAGGSEPTEILPAPKVRRTREVFILLAAVMAAAALVLASWVSTSRVSSADVGGLVIVTTPASAVVVVDGKRVGSTPFSSSNVSAGPHKVRISLAGYAPIEEMVHVAPNKVVELRYRLVAQ